MTDWGDVGFIKASVYRQAVLSTLSDGPALPSEISEATDSNIACVSNALSELREKDLVELLVPEARRKGRMYGLTDEGEAAWGDVEEADV